MTSTDAYGIDFGTTNTVVVDPDGEMPGGGTIPTLVVLDPGGGGDQGFVAAGHDALENLSSFLRDGYHIVRSVKTFLDADRRWDCGPHVWRPQQVVTRFLEHLIDVVDDAGAAGPLERAVFTLPNGTSATRRRLFRQAAVAAGIEVVGFISESTAAFVASEVAMQQQEKAAVFDWGGGTLDVSVLDVDRPRVRELSVRGYARAGDAVDELLAKWAFEHRAGADPAVPWQGIGEGQRQRLRLACEQAKIQLCGGRAEVELLEDLSAAGVGLVNVTIDRDRLRSLCEPMLGDAVELLVRAVQQAGVAPEELSHVVLVGGTSHLLGLEEAIRRRLPEDLDVYRPPTEERAVAFGAVQTATSGVRHELADFVDAVLAGDGGGRIPLAKPGHHAGSPPVVKRLRVIEETDHAHLPVCTRRADEGATDAYAGSVSAAVLGFLRETLTLRSRVTDDNTLKVTLGSDAGVPEDAETLELESLRFTYVFR